MGPRTPQSPFTGGQITNGVNPTFNVNDKSLLAHILGLITPEGVSEDVRPRNGTGIAVYGNAVDANGMPIANVATDVLFDYNGDGVADADGTDFRWNHSALANDTNAYATPFERFGTALQDSRPDVDYTYPDLNSPFLAYDTTIDNGGTPVRIVIPSYHRPQLFPAKRNTGFGDIYTDPQTAAQVLRPHLFHEYDASEDINGNGSLDPGEDLDGDGMISRIHRYCLLPAGTPALSGDRNRVIAPFPFGVDVDGDGN